MTKKGTIEEYQKISSEKKGRCLSTEYVNNHTKFIFECVDKHVFEALPLNIRKGHWCPTCAHGLSERVCREFFEIIFENKFPNIKPNWLINKKGNRMELDGYCEELGLAFEYQGQQHYHKIKIFTNRTFKEQKDADNIKRNICLEKKVVLIEIPYTVGFEKMEHYILEECKKNGIAVPKLKNIDYKNLNISSSKKLQECQDHAKSKKGLCLSSVYIDNKTNLKWQCKKLHIWNATPDNILKENGTWCPKCMRKVSDMNRRKYDIVDMQNIAKKRKGLCKSPEYLGFNNKHIWQCEFGHVWKAIPRSIIHQKTWCPKCNPYPMKHPKLQPFSA